MASAPAYAYLDPGTGSIILQAIIATVVAGFASVRLWRDKFLELIRFRKNSNKTEETINEDKIKPEDKRKL